MSAEHDVRGKTHYGESATAKRHTVICKQNRWDRSEFSLNLFLLTAWPFAKVVAWQTRGLYSPTLIQRTLTASLHIIICCKQSRTVIIIYAHTMKPSVLFPHRETFLSCHQGWRESKVTHGECQPQTVIRSSANKLGEFVPNAHWICSCWLHDHLP